MLLSCASSKVLQYDKIDEFQMNKEFEEMVKVEKSEEAQKDSPGVKKVSPAKKKKTPLEKSVKKPVEKIQKGIDRRPRTKAITQEEAAKIKNKKKVGTSGKEPKMEDSEGFLGRRPIVDPYRVGEEVELAVTYFNMAAGYMKLKVNPFVNVNARKSYDFSVSVNSSKVFSYFYAVDDKAQTFVDFESLVPSTYTIEVKETKQLKDIRSFFDFRDKKGVYWEKKKVKGKPEKNKKVEWKIEDYSQNVISAIFYLRSFQLKVGKKLSFRVADAGKNVVFKGEVLRKEKIDTKMGEMDTVVVKPTFEIDGAFKPVGDIFFWMTDDDRKFPVRIEAKIKIGTLVLKLENLNKGSI